MQQSGIDASIFPMEAREFRLFRDLVHKQTGIWLRDGKQVMLAARLSRRLRHHRMESFAIYYDFVTHSPESGDEMRELINCVTTNKTSFFREPHHFDYLRSVIVPPARIAARNGGGKIRVWSACCSTGEEPYSIAIALLEALQSTGEGKAGDSAPGLRRASSLLGGVSASLAPEIIASDIDTSVLETARRAIYPESSLTSIPRAQWGRYFLRGKGDMAGRVKVKPDIARLVRFERLNLMELQWPLEGLFDVIFFRNALIYFNRDTQDVFLRRMIRYLKPGGHLFLGNAEHIPWLHDLLVPLNQTMYRLRDGVQ